MKDGKPLVVVTGSSGLLGTALSKRLKDEATIVGLDRGRPKQEDAVDSHLSIDLADDESVTRAFTRLRTEFGLNIASFVHLAAYHEMSGDEDPRYKSISIEGTRRVLRALQSFDVTQFVFSSTMLVHEPGEPGSPINEDTPLRPKWPHPESKVETEKVIQEERGEIPTVILRLAGFYDEMGHSYPIAYQVRRILERAPTAMVYPGDVTHGESYVHLDDAVEAFVKVFELRNELPNETVLLIGEDEAMSFDERQRTIARLLHGEDWETREIPRAIAKAGAWIEEVTPYDDGDPFTAPFAVDLAGDHFELDTSRAKQLLGWAPKHSLRETLPVMIANLKRDPVAWYKANGLEPNDKVREYATGKSWR